MSAVVAPRTLSPDVRRVVAGRFVSQLGGSAGFFVGLWGLAAYVLEATPATLAVLMAGLSGAQLVGSALAGVAVDRFDPRRVLVAGEVAFVPAILVLTRVDTMLELTLLAPIAWFAHAFVMTAVASFPPYLVADARSIERATAMVEAAGTIAFIIGPVAGALVSKAVNLQAVFVLDAVTSILGLFVIWPVKVRDVVHATHHRRGLGELVAGFRQAYRTPPVALVLVLGTLTWMSFGTFSAIEPLFYRDVLGAPPEVLGYVNAVFGAGMAVGAIVLDRSAGRLTATRTVVILTAAGGIGALIYVGTDSLAVVVVGAVVWGLVLGLLLPLLRTLTHLHTPEGYLGRVTGVFNVHHSAGELLPLAIAPVLAGVLGVQGVLVGMGVVLLALAPLAWRPARRIDARYPVSPVPGRDLVDRLGDIDDLVIGGAPTTD
jgi:MFS transporter, DHA3 family, macrolide efflux protein